jgi:hypothetical protein
MQLTRSAVWGVSLVAIMVAGCNNYSAPVQPAAGPQATVLTATGDIAATVGGFRTLIGDPANGGIAGQQPAGRREVNWDGAGARPFNNQNNFPPDFFNTTVKSGLIYLGAAFRNDSLQFSEVNPTYAAEFKAFSRVLFSAVGSNVIDLQFRVAGSGMDLDRTSSIELFDKNDKSLGRFEAPKRSDANGLSFVGAKFDTPIVARVKITCGTGALGVGVNDITAGGTLDLVVIDNVIFGEPTAL